MYRFTHEALLKYWSPEIIAGRWNRENHLKVYFADQHSPWQRESNENINGLPRFFFPKGTDFHKLSQEQLDSVVYLINNRPRKCLGSFLLLSLSKNIKICCTWLDNRLQYLKKFFKFFYLIFMLGSWYPQHLL